MIWLHKKWVKIIRLMTTFSTLFFTSIVCGSAIAEKTTYREPGNINRAAWMSASWGIRFLLPAGEKNAVYKFNISKIAKQVEKLDSLSWVMLNLTNGNDGTQYTSPNKLLEAINPNMAPSRDVLGEAIALLAKKGVKTIVYFDSRGPRADNFNTICKDEQEAQPYCKRIRGVQKSWRNHIHSQGIGNQQAIAEYCIRYYSNRYGKLISGWWFDAGKSADFDLYANAARSGNPESIIAFNVPADSHDNDYIAIARQVGQSKFARTLSIASSEEDYTSGHPTPVKLKPPSWEGNKRMITSMKYWNSEYHIIPHVFLPMQKGWTRGEPAFTTSQLISWTLQTLKAKGAITWAVSMKQQADDFSLMEEVQLNQLIDVNQAVQKYRNTRININD